VTLLDSEGHKYYVNILVSQSADTVHCRTTDEEGREVPVFDRIRLVPNESDEDLPPYVRVLSEVGGVFSLENPWPSAADSLGRGYTGNIIEISMETGQALTFREALR